MRDSGSPATSHPPDAPDPAFPRPPASAALERLLDRNAPFSEVPLCPTLRAYAATSLVDVWQAAEDAAGCILPAPFWAFPWPGGIALARTILDNPALVAGRRVIDIGAGGGVSCFAAVAAGAARVAACDVDPWALAVTRLGAQRQAMELDTIEVDVTRTADALRDFDVILCGDLAYDRSTATRERAVIEQGVGQGALALIADAGRTYFDASGLEPIAEYTIRVVADLEGREHGVARVYALRP